MAYDTIEAHAIETGDVVEMPWGEDWEILKNEAGQKTGHRNLELADNNQYEVPDEQTFSILLED